MEDRRRCAVYVRMARCDDLADMEAQERMLLDVSDAHDLEVVKVYREIAPGCGGIEERPVLGDLIGEVADGAYDAVIIRDASRFTRGDNGAADLVLAAFQRSGTEVITPFAKYSPAERDEFRAMETAMLSPSFGLKTTVEE